jgi:protein gp37
VFCASLADVFDDHQSILPEWRDDLWKLIAKTPWLEWLLLTKRPENIAVPSALANVRIGVTAENQQRANERIPALLSRWNGPSFISYEPAVGPVDFSA